MNEIQVTLRGNVATEPRQIQFDDGNILTSFRLAATTRRRVESGEWVDQETTYVSVKCRRSMAVNAAKSVRKGHPVVVTGTLKERFWTGEEKSGHTLEVDADSLGHDLRFGTTQFVRIAHAERAPVNVSEYTVLDDEGPDGEGLDAEGPDAGGSPADSVA